MTNGEALIVTGLWIIVVVLYYFCGRRLGYQKGFTEGAVFGAKEMFSLLEKYKTDSNVGSSDE